MPQDADRKKLSCSIALLANWLRNISEGRPLEREYSGLTGLPHVPPWRPVDGSVRARASVTEGEELSNVSLVDSALSACCWGAGGGVVADGRQGQNVAAPVIPGELTSYRDVVRACCPRWSASRRARSPRPLRSWKNRRQPNFDEQQVPEQFRKFFEDSKGPQFEMPDNPRVGFGPVSSSIPRASS